MSMVCVCIRFCRWETMLLAILLCAFTMYVSTTATFIRMVAKTPDKGRERSQGKGEYMYRCALREVRATSLPDMHTIQ